MFAVSTILFITLQAKQENVVELLGQADTLIHVQKEQKASEVYQAMAESLGEAWKDLNAQLELRKVLLDQSVAFHQVADEVGGLIFTIYQVLKN